MLSFHVAECGGEKSHTVATCSCSSQGGYTKMWLASWTKMGFGFWELDGPVPASVSAVVTTYARQMWSSSWLWSKNPNSQSCISSKVPFSQRWVFQMRWGLYLYPIASIWWGEMRGQEGTSQWTCSTTVSQCWGFLPCTLLLWTDLTNTLSGWEQSLCTARALTRALAVCHKSPGHVEECGHPAAGDRPCWLGSYRKQLVSIHSWICPQWGGKRRKKPQAAQSTEKMEGRYQVSKADKSQRNWLTPSSLQL